MLFKAFSLCALILSGVAGAAAQLQGFPGQGRYTIRGASLDPNRFPPAQVRNPGAGQPLVIPGTPPAPGRDTWDLFPGASGGFIMRNVAFGTFLKVSPDNQAPITTDPNPNQATSFAVTPAGPGIFHVGVVSANRLWTSPAAVLPVFPPPDMVIRAQPANGRPEQLWRFTKL